MNFRKSSKWPLTPPPLIFGKSYCKFFPEFMTKVPFIMAKICNIIFWIGIFPKIHPFWLGHPSLMVVMWFGAGDEEDVEFWRWLSPPLPSLLYKSWPKASWSCSFISRWTWFFSTFLTFSFWQLLASFVNFCQLFCQLPVKLGLCQHLASFDNYFVNYCELPAKFGLCQHFSTFVNYFANYCQHLVTFNYFTNYCQHLATIN